MEDETTLEILVDLLNGVEAAIIQAKQRISEITGVKAVREENFKILNWKDASGNRIGEFQVASKEGNDEAKFNRAFTILTRNNASIGNRYHGEGYEYSYWVYGERIYRQPLKAKSK